MLTHTKYQAAFKNAIFQICGSREPPLACLADIGERAAKIAQRSKPWGARTLYVCLHLERYQKHNDKGAVKYGIGQELYNAVMHLAHPNSDALRGKRAVKVYARGVREGAVVLGHSRKCDWRKCRVHFVGNSGRRYCSDECSRLAHADQRKCTTRIRSRIARTARRRSEKRRTR